jgi:hypothetical protein
MGDRHPPGRGDRSTAKRLSPGSRSRTRRRFEPAWQHGDRLPCRYGLGLMKPIIQVLMRPWVQPPPGADTHLKDRLDSIDRQLTVVVKRRPVHWTFVVILALYFATSLALLIGGLSVNQSASELISEANTINQDLTTQASTAASAHGVPVSALTEATIAITLGNRSLELAALKGAEQGLQLAEQADSTTGTLLTQSGKADTYANEAFGSQGRAVIEIAIGSVMLGAISGYLVLAYAESSRRYRERRAERRHTRNATAGNR